MEELHSEDRSGRHCPHNELEITPIQNAAENPTTLGKVELDPLHSTF